MPSNGFRFLKLMPLVVILGIITLVFLSLRPIPGATDSNTSRHEGVVRQVLDGSGKNDIVIELQDDPNHYYVNRGSERGLSAKALHAELKGRKIDLLSVNHWTPLDPGSRSRHIAQIKVSGKMIYSEIR